MSSAITISRQRVLCHIGITEEERATQQTLEVSTSFPIPDCGQLAHKDEIVRTVDYHEVSILVNAIAIERPRKLIETLASDIAERLLREYLLAHIDIEIRKFALPQTEAVILNYRKMGNTRK